MILTESKHFLISINILEKNEFLMHHLSKRIERIYRDKNNFPGRFDKNLSTQLKKDDFVQRILDASPFEEDRTHLS